MWKSETVERALFKWPIWKRSIISQWSNSPSERQLQAMAAQELESLGFPSCLSLENYWISCITSDYNLDYPPSFKRIVAPEWISTSKSCGHNISGDFRILPPRVFDENDLKYEQRFYPFLNEEQLFHGQMFLPQKHPFYTVLHQVKGRPPSKGKVGKHPMLSDRLAVQCAALKVSGSTYVDIACELDLNITRPYKSEQSDTAKHLVQRGRRLIAETR